MNKLTPKQEKFIQEYLVDLNATQAAIRAGYAKSTAKHNGSKMLSNVGVMVEITKGKERMLAKVTKSTEITKERVLAEYGKLAFDMPLESNEIRAGDKNKALDSIGKHLGMFVDKVEITGFDGIKERLAAKLEKEQDAT